MKLKKRRAKIIKNLSKYLKDCGYSVSPSLEKALDKLLKGVKHTAISTEAELFSEFIAESEDIINVAEKEFGMGGEAEMTTLPESETKFVETTEAGMGTDTVMGVPEKD